MKFNEEAKDYSTIVALKTNNNNFIFVSDIESLKEYNTIISDKFRFASRLFQAVIILEFVIHTILSYYNLKECEERIGKITYNNYYLDSSNKNINYICASYLIHIFLMLGYFIIALITICKPSKLNFKVFELYIIIMMITDLFFGFVNQRNLYFALEGVINLLLVKYLKYLHREMTKVDV